MSQLSNQTLKAKIKKDHSFSEILFSFFFFFPTAKDFYLFFPCLREKCTVNNPRTSKLPKAAMLLVNNGEEEQHQFQFVVLVTKWSC